MVRYFDEIVMVIGDESSFRRGVLLATNENDVLLTFKPQRILTVGNRGYRATTSGTARVLLRRISGMR
jgi:hypothetical protein